MASSISMLSTYPPTRCGIASFAESLGDALTLLGAQVRIVALDYEDEMGDCELPIHRHRGAEDLADTVQALNAADVAIVQHEFGIYSGMAGDEVLAIVAGLGVPIMTVVHTVPETPDGHQRRVLQRLLDVSDAVIVLSYSAARVLRRAYEVRPGSLHVIPHGAADLWRLRRQVDAPTTPRLLTWGLIGEGKGLEWALEALALADDLDPLPEYVIAGSTHPKVAKRDGDRYLDGLHQRVESLGLTDRVTFVDGYLDEFRLARLISQAHAYVLPYDNDEQVTAGVLVEGLVAGGPVIATRFPHARELLGTGGGILVNRRSPRELAEAIRVVVADPPRTKLMREIAVESSRDFVWSRVADQYLVVADELTTFDERRLVPRSVIQIPALSARSLG